MKKSLFNDDQLQLIYSLGIDDEQLGNMTRDEAVSTGGLVEQLAFKVADFLLDEDDEESANMTEDTIDIILDYAE